MKRTAVVIAVVAGLALGTVTALALAHGGPGMSPAGAFAGGAVMQRIQRMLHHLDLSDEQEAEVRAILEAARPEFRAHLESLRAAREELRKLDPATFDEAKVRELAGAQAGEMVEMVVLGQKVRSQVWAVLTPEQREQAAGMQARMRERMEKMRDCMGEAGGPPVE